jgi:DNA end-binding protein Ku
MAAEKKSRKPRAAKAASTAEPAAPIKTKVPGLSARPVWQGHLRLSLVSCAVALYRATSRSNDISFNLLNPKTNNRVRMVPTDPETGPVERSELVRGYEIEKNRYVILSDDELDSVKLQTTHTLDIERFVDADSVDRLFWGDPYVLLPADEMSANAYAVIRDAMADTKRIALGRVVMHTRERLMAIEARDRGLLASTLRMRDEVVNLNKALESVPDTKPDPRMIEIAEKIIEQQEGAFEPEEFRDRYEDSLRELIAKKERGERPVAIAPPPDTGNVIDLMEALKKSLRTRGNAPPPPKHTAAKAQKKKAR